MTEYLKKTILKETINSSSGTTVLSKDKMDDMPTEYTESGFRIERRASGCRIQRTAVNKLKIILIKILFQIHLCHDIVMIRLQTWFTQDWTFDNIVDLFLSDNRDMYLVYILIKMHSVNYIWEDKWTNSYVCQVKTIVCEDL